jgi:hypothetical protein
VPSAGFEPAFEAPEAPVLSIELRGQKGDLDVCAEGAGFEPAPPLRENGFRDHRFEPLSQPSKVQPYLTRRPRGESNSQSLGPQPNALSVKLRGLDWNS